MELPLGTLVDFVKNERPPYWGLDIRVPDLCSRLAAFRPDMDFSAGLETPVPTEQIDWFDDLMTTVRGFFAAALEARDCTPPIRLSDVPFIFSSSGSLIPSRDRIPEYVEFPLVAACQLLFDLNIQTIESHANLKSNWGNGTPYILIDYENLSDENKRVAEMVGEVSGVSPWRTCFLPIPCEDLDTLVETLSQRALEIVRKFQQQLRRCD